MLELKKIGVTVKSSVLGANKKEILSEISFSLPAGDALGIVGKSGSGKTTLANVILGLIPNHTGDVLLDGKNVYSGYTRLELAKKVQLITQNPETSFDPDFSLRDSFAEILKAHRKPTQNKAIEDTIRPFLKEVGLETIDLDKPPTYFSGGELQRLSIVRALMVSPQILIFDEADSMLDTKTRMHLFTKLNALRHKYGLTYIYITHDICVLPHLVDLVLVLQAGKVEELGGVERLRTSQNPTLQELRDSLNVMGYLKKGVVNK